MKRLVPLFWAIGVFAIQPSVAQPTPVRIVALSEKLPELWQFLTELETGVNSGTVTSTEALIARSQDFYTPARMGRIEAVLPGWAHMASFEHGKTLWHVNVAMVALLQLDEYRAMSADQRAVQEWIVLLHDLAKEPEGGRDHRHSFRSAAHAARLLPSLGFPVTGAHRDGFNAWFQLTDTAVRLDETQRLAVQDNGKLPDIMNGLRVLFAEPTRSALTAIALHQSITSLVAWPVMAPMTRKEVKSYVDAEVVPALKALMLADSGGWNLFEPSTLKAMYTETRAVFADLPATEGR